MAKKSISISKEHLAHKSMDYDALRLEGIQHLQKYAGGVWTDYNHHDPGVTILEYLCFGITDLGYRGNFPITDLLYSWENRRIVRENNAFIPAEDILPCAPLTIEDYRKLLLDRLADCIDNLWIEPVADAREGLSGLYDIWLQRSDSGGLKYAPEEIIEKARRVFARHRNLCEDVRAVYIMEQEALELSATINLDVDASTEQVVADIIHQLEHFLSPKIQFYQFEELRASGYAINDLMDGPMPHNGFILSEDLKPMVSVLYISQLRDIITAINGVRSLEQVRVTVNGLPQYSEEIIIPKNTFLVLSDTMRSGSSQLAYPIRFVRNSRPVAPNFFLVKQILGGQMAREHQQFHQELNILAPPAVANKDLKDIGAYYSIQRFFPAVYGIGAFGLPRDANFFRQAQARQLKGYLAIFEIILASCLKQLTEVKRLFSIGHETDQAADSTEELKKHQANGPSYFAQFPFDIPDIEPLINLTSSQQDIQPAINERLAQHTAMHDPSLDRRNEFLDHLLARFSEIIPADLLQAQQQDDSMQLKEKLIELKCRVLRDYANLSRDRGQGFDYLQKEPDPAATDTLADPHLRQPNISGLKKRLYYWLNLENPEQKRLTHAFTIPGFELQKRTHDPAAATTSPPQGIPMRTLLRNGRNPENYLIKLDTVKNRWHVFFQYEGSPEPSYLLHAPTEAEARAKCAEFIKALDQFNQQCSGFHLIEHVLLRPLHKKGFKLVLTVDLKGASRTFESLHYSTKQEVDGLAQDLLMLCSDRRNFSILPDGKEFFILLEQDKRPVMASKGKFGQAEAGKLVDALVHRMQDTLKTDPSQINNWIETLSESLKRLDGPDFYVHRLSLVLPNWPAQFGEERFKLLLKNLVAQNVPAHLRVDFHWLDWSAMADFEDKYQAWIEAKRQDITPHEQDDLAFKLVAMLTKGTSYAATVEERLREEVPHDLSPARYQAILSHSGLSFLFKPTDLQIIQGVDATTEYWLQKANISTWSLLAVASADQVKELQLKAGMRDYALDFDSWKIQASLAVAGDWQALEAYQEQEKQKKEQEARTSTAKLFPDLRPGYNSKIQQMVETRPRSMHDE